MKYAQSYAGPVGKGSKNKKEILAAGAMGAASPKGKKKKTSVASSGVVGSLGARKGM